MRFKKMLALCISISLVLSMSVGCSNGTDEEGSSPYADFVAAYYENIDTTYAYDIAYTLSYDQKYLSNKLGFRTAGSDAEHAAADYLTQVMSDIGLSDIEKVPVTVDKWQFNDASFKLDGDDYEVMPASYATSGTDLQGITAEILDVGMGMSDDYEGIDVKDKIVLVGVDQMNESWIDAPLREAYDRGAAAIITYDVGGYATISDDAVNMQDVCVSDLIPCVSISAKDGAYYKEKIAAGMNKATLKVDNEIGLGEGISYNVIGKIPGKSSEQQIIVSGHYDIYFNGFQDDSCAIGLIMAMAKSMIDSGYTPENDIVFVCHGSEEWGASASQNDWTIGAWEMIHNAKPEWVGKTIAMLNFELPAFYEGDDTTYFSAVPEFATLVNTLVNDTGLLNNIDTSIYANGISDEAVPTNTMEDGVSYRFAGVPYLINIPTATSDWISQRYHTVYDDADTFSAEVMDINLKMFGAMAIYIDQSPALMLDFRTTCALLKDTLPQEIADAAEADTTAYQTALADLSEAADTLYQKGLQINKDYETAFADGDTEAMADLRTKGIALNKTLLSAFKYVQDNLIGLVATSDVVIKHESSIRNIELIEQILTSIQNQELENTEATGALDLAWQVNGMTDYSYYNFSSDGVKKSLDLLFDDKNPGNTFWGSGKVDPLPQTSEGIYALFDEDFDKAKTIYMQALKHEQNLLREHVTSETSAMIELKSMITE